MEQVKWDVLTLSKWSILIVSEQNFGKNQHAHLDIWLALFITHVESAMNQ